MRIHDTLTGDAAGLSESGTVGIYLCGVTVYDEAHVGHARTVVVFDVLRRYLEYRGAAVNLVQNFTDVDDKIIDRAASLGQSAAELSSRYIARYLEDSDALGVARATTYPLATEHIPDMQEMIRGLLGSGAAYVARNGVYFAVSKFPGYGKLSGKVIGELRAGARVEVDGYKRDPLDFALWKFADSDPSWDSPWGRGRPGWHIECSAMGLRYLGESFELHGGGRDLIFPHHENEIAQSEAFTSRPPAKLWMHVGMVTIGGQKMSKSLGNIRSVWHSLQIWGPNVVRLFCLSGHYAKPVDYSDDAMVAIASLWRQAETAYHEMLHAAGGSSEILPPGHLDRFLAALGNDLDTRLALDEFFLLVREVNAAVSGPGLGPEAAGSMLMEFEAMAGILGLRVPKATDSETAAIMEAIGRRDELRAQGRYEEADRIREGLAGSGIELVDHKSGTIWVKRERIGYGA